MDCDRCCFVVVGILAAGGMLGTDSECLGGCRDDDDAATTAFVSLLMDGGSGGTGGGGEAGDDDECLEMDDFCEADVYVENQSL